MSRVGFQKAALERLSIRGPGTGKNPSSPHLELQRACTPFGHADSLVGQLPCILHILQVNYRIERVDSTLPQLYQLEEKVSAVGTGINTRMSFVEDVAVGNRTAASSGVSQA